ncbi:MAG TPA: PAS domain S-box protein, partial [Thermodesulfovibrionales bacterium]|nr:PAS domain S-box protein [Thermodesulfovibrionales bacterium]
MKKKIILIVGISSLFFFAAGIFIIVTIERTTSELDNLIKLHQVEILREHLLIRIKRVQADLNLKGTRYARGIDTVVFDVINMGEAVDICFDCHHSESVTERIKDLKDHIGEFKDTLSRVLTIRANEARLREEEDVAFRAGEELIEKVNAMIAMTTTKLTGRTESALDKIARTKTGLFVLVAAGPFLAAGFAFFFIRAFSKPVNALLDATRKLKGGDLDHRVRGLKDEFGEVAESFNEMAGSLKGQMYRIEESEKRYRALFERAGDAIFIIDADGDNKFQIVAANKAAALMHGYTVEELLGMKITDLDTPEAAEEASPRVERMLGGEWIHEELSHRRKDGAVFPVEISAGLLEAGNHRYILAFDRDVTERKEAAEALQRVEQLKVVGELAAGLAHEIKNPLTGMKAAMEVLSEEAVMPEEDRQVLVKVVGEIKRIESLLKDLLSFARPPSPQFTPVDINGVLDMALAFSFHDSSLSGKAKAINIAHNFDERVPETMADPMQLQQVFMNIFLNAADAMAGEGTLTVTTDYEEMNDSIRITISDTGTGIDGKAMDSIFKPFFTTKPKGTGLGLAITKRLIEQHGGAINVHNNADKGATFVISIP